MSHNHGSTLLYKVIVMGPVALILGIILYIIVAIDFYKREDYPLCLVFICYAVANIGFIWAALRKSGDL